MVLGRHQQVTARPSLIVTRPAGAGKTTALHQIGRAGHLAHTRRQGDEAAAGARIGPVYGQGVQLLERLHIRGYFRRLGHLYTGRQQLDRHERFGVHVEQLLRPQGTLGGRAGDNAQ
jgi:hypothetical protein